MPTGPSFTSPFAFFVAENTSLVGQLTAADDLGAPVTYSIDMPLGNPSPYYDSTKFYVHPTTGVLTLDVSPNFEAPHDYQSNGVFDLVVRGSSANGFSTQTITVTITNVNEGTLISSNGGGATAAFAVNENQTIATTVVARDFTGPSVTYAIAGGWDASKFVINSTTGVLSFINAPNFEASTDFGLNRIYDVTVSASDGSVTDTQALAVSLANVNETVVFTSNGGGDVAYVTRPENFTDAILITAADPEAANLTYSIIGGADAGLLSVTSSGSFGGLSFVTWPNFEAPLDANGDNVFEVLLQVSDGTFTDTQMQFVTVTNVNETPFITSNGAGSSAFTTLAENQAAVTTVTATDGDGTAQIYAISGGADASKFVIDAVTGALAFRTAPNFEAPDDVGLNRTYNVTVSASDGTLIDTQALSVAITNINEAPVVTSNGGGDAAAITVSENTLAVTTVTSIDPENSARTYSIGGGDDAARFTVDTATGVLRFVAAPNFEAPSDSNGDNVYNVAVRASDGTLFDTQVLSVAVSNVNDNTPAFVSAATQTVGENATVASTVVATDADGDALTYGIAGGDDAARFSINAVTGAVSFIGVSDFEAPGDADGDNHYQISVSARDGTSTQTQALTIMVANTNDNAPVLAPTAALSVAEHATVVTTVTATDIDGDAITFTKAGGTDSALFMIDAATGALSFIAAPNFETPADADGDNIYDVSVVASDGIFTDTRALSITVGNVNEAVAIISGAAFSVAENETAITAVTASDVDGDAVAYTIAGGADAARFAIDTLTGALSFVAAPNFEMPGDADADNIYDVVVAATDGQFTDSQAVSVTVANANDVAPVFADHPSLVAVEENTTDVLTLGATDSDGGVLNYALAGGADAGFFAIDAQTGRLTFATAPDFETPNDADGDNVYDLIVRVSDGVQSTTDNLGVMVNNDVEGASIVGTKGHNIISTTTSPAGQPRATALDDWIDGGAGADTISSGAGNDWLYGGTGNDKLKGEGGRDWLSGGAGADQFILASLTDSTTAASDFIWDFSRSDGDRINLNTLDANSLRAGNQAFAFIGSASFTGVAGQLRFDNVDGNTFVTGDVNGDSIADFGMTLFEPTQLFASDFVL